MKDSRTGSYTAAFIFFYPIQPLTFKIFFRRYRRFTINENSNIKVLRSGVFNDITFEEFHIVNSVLETVEAGALDVSFQTATTMYFYNNNLGSFPTQDLPSFPNLRELRLYKNSISAFPSLSSQSLEILSLGDNPFGSIPSDAFSDTPSLKEVSLYGAGVTQISPGTFSVEP